MLKDRDIRGPLFHYLRENMGGLRFFEEKDIGKSRADVVMVTEDSFIGIEIKSDADGYRRLPGQVVDYVRYYDYNIAAVGSSHAESIEEHIPENWGILTVEETEAGVDFYLLRKPRPNPEMDLSCKLSLLWRPELQQVIRDFEFPHLYEHQTKKFVIRKIAETVPYDKLRIEMSAILINRDEREELAKIRNYRILEGRKPGSGRRKYSRKKCRKKQPHLFVSHVISGRRNNGKKHPSPQ